MVTILNLDAQCRSSLVNQLLLCVTPGPKQPADLESFLHPIAEELHTLATGGPIVSAPGTQLKKVLRAYTLHISTDMPAGDKIMNATGHDGHQPNRFRAFSGVYFKSHTYYPPIHPSTSQALFSVDNCSVPRRTAASIGQQVEEVEAARRAGKPRTHLAELSKLSGFKGYSLLGSPSPANRIKYSGFAYLWILGPADVPYHCMHLLLLDVVPLLWLVFSGQLGGHGDEPSNLAMSASVVADIGRELRDARPTVPRSQARSLRNLAKSFRSCKAVDWIYFLLCTGEVVLADRISPPLYRMVMHLVSSCRLLFRPRGLSIEDL